MAHPFVEPCPIFHDQLPSLPPLSLSGPNVRFVTHRSNIRSTAGNYEVDALLGIYILKYTVASWMRRNYPESSPGEITIAVDSQVNKDNLARICAHFGLHGLLNTDAVTIRNQNMYQNKDIRAALFQAYVHGLYMEDEQTAIDFIEAIFSVLLQASLGDYAISRILLEAPKSTK